MGNQAIIPDRDSNASGVAYKFLSSEDQAKVWQDIIADRGSMAIPEASRQLAGRHRDMVALLFNGLQGQQIAAKLGIAPRTVKQYLNKLYVRFGITGRYVRHIRLVYLLHEHRREFGIDCDSCDGPVRI